MDELPHRPQHPEAADRAEQPNNAPGFQHHQIARRAQCLGQPADRMPYVREENRRDEQSPNASPVRENPPEEQPVPLPSEVVESPALRLPPFSQPWATRRYPTSNPSPRPSQNNNFGIVIPPRRFFQPLGYPATPEELRRHARRERARIEENELERENLRLLVRARRYLEDARIQAVAMGRQSENREARRRRQATRMNHFQAINLAPRMEEPPVARMTEEEDNSDTDSSRCGSPSNEDPERKSGEVAVQTVQQPDPEEPYVRDYVLRTRFISGRRQL